MTPPQPRLPHAGEPPQRIGMHQWQTLIDHMACGIVVFDAHDQLVLCNRDFLHLYGPIADHLLPGRTFEETLRQAVASGLVPESGGDPEAWIRERLRQHGRPGSPLLRQMPGGRWRRITETRLPDDGLLAFSIDVTEEVRKSQALDAALKAAEVATTRLEEAIEALPAGFELWGADDRLLLSNHELRRLYPRIADRLVPGVRWEDLVRANAQAGGLVVPDGDLEAYITRRRAARRSPGEPTTHATGEGRWIRSIEHVTRDGGLVGIRIDVSELTAQRIAADAAQRLAERASQTLRDAVDALPDGFALFDADDRLVAFNARYVDLYSALAPVIALGATFESLLRHGVAMGQFPQAVGREDAWIEERLERHRHPGPPVLQELQGNRWLRVDERRTRDGGVAGVRADVTELVRREQELTTLNARLDELNLELELLSDTDGLTAVANRRHFDRRLAEEWSRVARHKVSLALLMIDVDHFKLYNDLQGHQAGDACLSQVAARLVACARRPADLVARYGGEEFALLLPHTDLAGAKVEAERCLAEIARAAIPHPGSPTAPHLTLSIGVAVADSGEPRKQDQLLRRADAALYRAKQSGRNRFEIG